MMAQSAQSDVPVPQVPAMRMPLVPELATCVLGSYHRSLDVTSGGLESPLVPVWAQNTYANPECWNRVVFGRYLPVPPLPRN